MCVSVYVGGRGVRDLLQLSRRICFGWPTEDVSVDFFLYRWGFYLSIYLFFFSPVPPEESALSTPEWEAVNGI